MKQLGRKIRLQTQALARDQLPDKDPWLAWEQVEGQLEEQVQEQVWRQVRYQVWDQVEGRLNGATR
jgi:hypothetical protein